MSKKSIVKDVMFLSQKSTPATTADIQVAQDLTDTLIANKERAVGLAANMIGVQKNIIAFFAGPLPMVMFNPRIINKSGEYHTQEGCLSLSGQRPTTRYREITVEFQNHNFEKTTQSFTGFVAEVIQHEIDHTKGIII
ncbi:peptide deformylase [Lactobacillus sp. PV037]|uniref:peptide deformylase n=1 Tax=unclassified Lactobacillus TaxID=2620435 RepID=UPI00223F0887|nr:MULTISPECIES: peptide deformylase [unclassified Lactobacillus]QNQ81567.1 peptide deformylase [Lactobacillus sp. PV012]QNQ84386.1 peptide deformylase [Lactobacillus sp. PV037]